MLRPRFIITALILCSLVLVAQTVSRKHLRAATESDPRHPFVGTWKLVSSTEVLPDGTQRPYGFGLHPQGYLMYDATGHMCAQVANMDRPRWKDPDHPLADEVKTAFDGFGGYCGTYTVDDKNSTLAHMPEVAMDPNLAGSSKPRNYKFQNGQLVYTGSDPFEDGGVTHWTMVWERLTK
ncbi:MAG TPA: lipocalin-like domain-containing protein [Terriglobales bacterium]